MSALLPPLPDDPEVGDHDGDNNDDGIIRDGDQESNNLIMKSISFLTRRQIKAYETDMAFGDPLAFLAPPLSEEQQGRDDSDNDYDVEQQADDRDYGPTIQDDDVSSMGESLDGVEEAARKQYQLSKSLLTTAQRLPSDANLVLVNSNGDHSDNTSSTGGEQGVVKRNDTYSTKSSSSSSHKSATVDSSNDTLVSGGVFSAIWNGLPAPAVKKEDWDHKMRLRFRTMIFMGTLVFVASLVVFVVAIMFEGHDMKDLGQVFLMNGSDGNDESTALTNTTSSNTPNDTAVYLEMYQEKQKEEEESGQTHEQPDTGSTLEDATVDIFVGPNPIDVAPKVASENDLN